MQCLILDKDIRNILYSIIDIEATGGNAKIGKITEVAIYLYDGNGVVKEFQSLINPSRPIPPYVQRLTGITDRMVAQAPAFEEVAREIGNLMRNSCFVAHNVKADYSFIQAEMKQAGIQFQSERLCTLELSKALIPEAGSHGLDNICTFLDIEVAGRHRAQGDALATLELFKHLQQRDQNELIKKLSRKP